MRHTVVPVFALIAALAGVSALNSAQAQQSVVDSPRATFDAEVCKVDGLTTAECDCAWTYISGKMSAADLKLAMLITASNSQDPAVSKKADIALDKSNASDKRRDTLASDTSALIIDAEDACQK
ncbi:MAG: hypothetical protein R3F24_01885 [Gammaproteobacteria bacterium]